MGAITINKDGDLMSGDVSLNLNSFLDKLDTKAGVFISTVAPKDFKLLDLWYDPSTDIIAIGRIVNGKICWVELPFGIEIDDTLLSTDTSSGGDVTTAMLDSAIGSVRSQVLDLNIKNNNGVIVDNYNNSIYDPDNIMYGGRNRVINGDMVVAQRGTMHALTDDGEYTADRAYCEVEGGSIEVRREEVYSSGEGKQANVIDILGNGKCVELFEFNGDMNGASGNYSLSKISDDDDDVTYGTGQYGGKLIKGNTRLSWDDFVNTLPDGEPFSVSMAFYMNSDISYVRPFDFYSRWRAYVNIAVNALYVDGAWLSSDFTANMLHHIIFSYNTTPNHEHVVTIWLDGINIGIVNSAAIDDRDDTSAMGSYYDGNSNYYTNNILQLRYYNDIILPTEAKQIYLEDMSYINKTNLKTIVTADNDISLLRPYTYRFEGQHLIDTITGSVAISFNFRSDVTGDYTLSLINKTTDDVESYLTTFNYSDTTTEFQRIVAVIPMTEFRNYVAGNNQMGFELNIAGSGTAAPGDKLQTGEYIYLDGAVKLTTGNWVAITDVQVEKGERATIFEKTMFDITQQKCLRYYEILISTRTVSVEGEADGRQIIPKFFYKMLKRDIPIVPAVVSCGYDSANGYYDMYPYGAKLDGLSLYNDSDSSTRSADMVDIPDIIVNAELY